MGEEIIVNLTQKIGITDGARRNVLRGNTGRETGDITPEGADAEQPVTEWRSTASDALSAHPVTLAFQAELKTDELAAGELACFRGRVAPANPRLSGEYAPPKPEWVGVGRYNEAGHPVLYLADSTNGVLKELASRDGEIWCHQYSIPAKGVRIADLRPNMQLPIVNHAFEFAEQDDGDEFSRTLASLVARNFDGMLVPGVRGVNGKTYNNVVIFKFELWQDWLRGEPTELARNG